MKAKTAGVNKKLKSLHAKALKLGLSVDLPLRRSDRLRKPHAHPTLAPDKRTDIRTIDLVRKGRDY